MKLRVPALAAMPCCPLIPRSEFGVVAGAGGGKARKRGVSSGEFRLSRGFTFGSIDAMPSSISIRNSLVKSASSRARSLPSASKPGLRTRAWKALKVILQPVAVIGVCLALGGCAEMTTGRDFDAAKARQIVRRKTTAKKVLALLGSPGRTYEVKPAGEGWTYSFQSAVGTPNGYRKHLTILFDKNKVVVNYWLHQGPIEGQQGVNARQQAGGQQGLNARQQAPSERQLALAQGRKTTPFPKDGRTAYMERTPARTMKATPSPSPLAVKAPSPTPLPEKRAQNTARSTPPATHNLAAGATPKGPVKTTVANQSAAPLTVRVERNGSTVAEIRMAGQETRNVLLPRGEYGLKMKVNNQYYRAPGFSIALNTNSMNLIWKDANLANLQPISAQEFER